MNTSKILINTLIFLLVCLGLWAGYVYLFGDSAETGSTITVNNGSEREAQGVATEESEFVALLNRLNTVNLDVSFLTDATFSTNLENYATVLFDRPRGRSNPFADFGVGNLTPATSSSTPASAPTTNVQTGTSSGAVVE